MSTRMISMRIPTGLAKWLQGMAKKEHRTRTGQMIHILEAAKQASAPHACAKPKQGS